MLNIYTHTHTHAHTHTHSHTHSHTHTHTYALLQRSLSAASVFAALCVLRPSNASSAANTTRPVHQTCASNPWTATGLSTCTILNGHKVESEWMTKIDDKSAYTLNAELTVESTESYDKCKTAREASRGTESSQEACYANTNACKQAMADWNCLFLSGSGLCDGDKPVHDKAVPETGLLTGGKPCHGLCLLFQQACLPFDTMATTPTLDKVCSCVSSRPPCLRRVLYLESLF